jgi:hypothetical protein
MLPDLQNAEKGIAMFALTLSVALAYNQTTPYPDGFAAYCSHGEQSYVFVRPQPSRLAMTDSGDTVEILRKNGQFVVYTSGADSQVMAGNGNGWKLDVLKLQRGDLVLSVEAPASGASITIYHLRYEGTAGMLTVESTHYYGPPTDEASLSVRTCRIEMQPSK